MEHARQYGKADVEQLCGIRAADFDAFVELYLQAKCASLSVGVGMERNRNGGSGIRAALALQALTGHFGRLGTGIMLKQSAILPKDSTRLQRSDLLPAGTCTLNILDVGRCLLDETLDPPLKAVLIYNHNPVAMHPDQQRMQRALSQESVFVAGCDVVMTDSMKYCDVILPAASVFEYADIYGAYGHSYLQRAEAVIPLVGEALPNTEIFRAWAHVSGWMQRCFRTAIRN
ncbi:MAG: molybdopterin-dependent oxidoreductase [Thiolinea sp.]